MSRRFLAAAWESWATTGSILHVHSFFETRGLRYDPDVVLVGYVLNDPIPPVLMFRAIETVKARRRLYDRWVRHSQLATLIWLRSRQLIARDLTGGYEHPLAWKIVTTSFERFATLSEETGVPVAVAIFPQLIDFDDYPYADIHALVSTAAREAGLPVLDLIGAFAKVAPETVKLAPLDFGHPNAAGHRIAAERIHEYLLAEGLVP